MKALNVQVEQEAQKRSFLQNDLTMQSSQMSLLQSRVTQLQRELSEARQARTELLEQLQRLRATRQVDELQTKELADQLEAEQYFTVSGHRAEQYFTVSCGHPGRTVPHGHCGHPGSTVLHGHCGHPGRTVPHGQWSPGQDGTSRSLVTRAEQYLTVSGHPGRTVLHGQWSPGQYGTSRSDSCGLQEPKKKTILNCFRK